MMKRLIALALLIPLGLTTAPAYAASAFSAGKWDEETIELFGQLPVLDGGRIKPMDTYAQFVMLRINGKRSYIPIGEDGEEVSRREKMGPVEWLMDCLFFPEVASDYPVFIVDNADVITTLGLERHDDQRDRYSYNELLPARQELMARAQSAQRLEQRDRSYQQNIMLSLNNSVFEFEALIHYLDFAREDINFQDSRLMMKVMGIENEDAEVGFADFFEKSADIQKGLIALNQVVEENGTEQFQSELDAVDKFLFPLMMAEQTAIALRLFPPAHGEDPEWRTPAEMTAQMWQTPLADHEIALLRAMDSMVDKVDQPLAFKTELKNFHSLLVNKADDRGEYAMVPMELSYYKSQWIYRAQIVFVFSFILAALLWLNPNSAWMTRATWVSVIVPLIMLTTAITIRCIIRGRPPVTTLYETVLFITAVAVLCALFMEYVNRQKIALSVAAFLGALGLFVAQRYEITNQQDTMPSLVAVLDTNFWLATHVTIINIGYAAGMLAAAISHIFIIGKLFRLKKDNPAFFRGITRMVYGVTCFGLLFAFVGTVLGGIWANYSWGRFWGWDPKENGAALICLCQIAILHARMGGYIKQMGIHIAAIFTACVVGFSWWGVNLLGVGLHSYGFTEGIWTATYLFWGVEGFFMLLGFYILFRDRSKPTASEPQKVDTPDEAVMAK